MKYSFALLLSSLITIGVLPQPLAAQNPPAEKQKAFLTMKYVKEDGQTKVIFRLFTKEGKKINPVQFAIVNLFLDEETKWGMMGNITTDSNGGGAVTLRQRFARSSEKMTEYHLIGSMKNDPRLQETQTMLAIKPANLALSLYREDTTKYAKAILTQMDSTGAWVPVQGIKVDFYVKKDYNLLPSAITDENGEAILALPNGLKGDNLGNIKIVATIDANEKYGTLIASAEEKWTEPLNPDDRLISNLFIIGFWGIIIFIILQLIRTRFFNKGKGQ